MLAATGGKATWYLTRGTGMMAYLLLTASVVLGIVEVRRWQSPGWPRFVTAGLHRSVSLLSVAFVAIHVATTVVDGFAPIGWLDAVIPFRSPYRPLWLGLGTVATDVLLALVASSLIRGRLGYRAWRAVHWAAYGCWPVAMVHGLGTGTDTARGWAIAVNGIGLAAVVLAVWWRLAQAWHARAEAAGRGPAGRGLADRGAAGRRPNVPDGWGSAGWGSAGWGSAGWGEAGRRPDGPGGAGLGVGFGVLGWAMVLSVVVPAAIVAWLLMGPLQPGWARRAGTPSRLRRQAPISASISVPIIASAGTAATRATAATSATSATSATGAVEARGSAAGA